MCITRQGDKQRAPCSADDVAPRQQKSLWLAALFLCFPTGFAVGYIYGGLAGTAWGWRTAFLGECAAMSPLALLCLLGPAVDIKRQHNSPSGTPFAVLPHLATCCCLVITSKEEGSCRSADFTPVTPPHMHTRSYITTHEPRIVCIPQFG